MRRFRIKERMIKLGHLDPDGNVPEPDADSVRHADQFVSFNDYVRAVNSNGEEGSSGGSSSSSGGGDGGSASSSGDGSSGVRGDAAEQALVRLRGRRADSTASASASARSSWPPPAGLSSSDTVPLPSSNDGRQRRITTASSSSSSSSSSASPPSSDAAAAGLSGLELVTSFDKRPREVKAFLDRFVMQQHDAKKALAVALCDHYNHVRRCVADESGERQHLRHYVKPNVLLLGPSGVGKTHLVRTLAKLIGVPFVKVDATKFSATGYVGGDVEEPLRSLVAAADGDVRLAEYGIVYVDEVDKLSAGLGANLPPGSVSTGGGATVNTRDVQTALLKLMEDGEVSLPAGMGHRSGPPPPSSSSSSVNTGYAPPSYLQQQQQQQQQQRTNPNPYGGGTPVARYDATSSHFRFRDKNHSGGMSSSHPLSSSNQHQHQRERAASANSASAGSNVLSTKHVLFIFSGAFNALRASADEEREKQMAEKQRATEAGEERAEEDVETDGEEEEALEERRGGEYETKHFVDFGLEPEFIGRIPVRVGLHALGEEDLLSILAESEDSVLRQFEDDFAGYGIDLSLDPEALQAVARRASAQGTGARGLLTVLDRVLREFKFELPSTPLSALAVDARTVREPRAALRDLLASVDEVAGEEEPGRAGGGTGTELVR